VYVYRRDAGSTFELEQRMTADGLFSRPDERSRGVTEADGAARRE
jgi:hypothetical protein